VLLIQQQEQHDLARFANCLHMFQGATGTMASAVAYRSFEAGSSLEAGTNISFGIGRNLACSLEPDTLHTRLCGESICSCSL